MVMSKPVCPTTVPDSGSGSYDWRSPLTRAGSRHQRRAGADNPFFARRVITPNLSLVHRPNIEVVRIIKLEAVTVFRQSSEVGRIIKPEAVTIFCQSSGNDAYDFECSIFP